MAVRAPVRAGRADKNFAVYEFDDAGPEPAFCLPTHWFDAALILARIGREISSSDNSNGKGSEAISAAPRETPTSPPITYLRPHWYVRGLPAAPLPQRADRAGAPANVGRRRRTARIIARSVAAFFGDDSGAEPNFPPEGVETMIGGGSGRTVGADGGGVDAIRGGSGVRGATSCTCAGASLAPRRRSSVARTRSLVFKCSSGRDCGLDRLGPFRRRRIRRGDDRHDSRAGGLSWEPLSPLSFRAESTSAGAYPQGCSRSPPACQRISPTAFRPQISRTAFSETPFALTPGSGKLAVSEGGFEAFDIALGGSTFLGLTDDTAAAAGASGAGLGGDVMVDDVGPDDGRGHRG